MIFFWFNRPSLGVQRHCSPSNCSNWLDFDNRSVFEFHVTVLSIFPPKQEQSTPVFPASIEESSCALDYHVVQLTPVFVIVVNDETNIRVLNNIQNSAQGKWSSSLGLLVDCTIDGIASIRETDWHDQRFSISSR